MAPRSPWPPVLPGVECRIIHTLRAACASQLISKQPGGAIFSPVSGPVRMRAGQGGLWLWVRTFARRSRNYGPPRRMVANRRKQVSAHSGTLNAHKHQPTVPRAKLEGQFGSAPGRVNQNGRMRQPSWYDQASRRLAINNAATYPGVDSRTLLGLPAVGRSAAE